MNRIKYKGPGNKPLKPKKAKIKKSEFNAMLRADKDALLLETLQQLGIVDK